MRRGSSARWSWAGVLGLAVSALAVWATVWLVRAPSADLQVARSVSRESRGPHEVAAPLPVVTSPELQPSLLEISDPPGVEGATAVDASAEAASEEPVASADEARLELSVVAGRNGTLEPQAHADLALTLRDAGADRGPIQRHRTDAAGRLVLALPPGLLWVTAWSEDRAGEPVERELRAGESTELVLELLDCATVVGEVRDAGSGHPIAGARVSLGWRREFDHALTDLEGFFELQRVAFSDAYEKLVVDADGYGPEQVFLRTHATGRWSIHALSESARAASGASLPAQVSLELWSTAQYRGRVVDDRGLPVRDARVEALGYYTILRGASTPDRASTRSDDSGAFVLTGLRSDITHSVSVRAAGLAEWVRRPEWVEGRNDHDLGVIHMAPQAQLTVAVVDASGAPAEALRVDVRAARTPASEAGGAAPPDEPRGRRSDYVPRAIRRDARTDASGYVRFDELPAGSYELSLSLSRRFGSIAREHVVLAEGQDVVAPLFRVPATLDTLEGWVGGPSGALGEARVVVEPEGGEPVELSTDALGAFRLAGLPVDTRVRLGSTWTDAEGAAWKAERRVGARDRPVLQLLRADP